MVPVNNNENFLDEWERRLNLRLWRSRVNCNLKVSSLCRKPISVSACHSHKFKGKAGTKCSSQLLLRQYIGASIRLFEKVMPDEHPKNSAKSQLFELLP
jgi:hypothetical protein